MVGRSALALALSFAISCNTLIAAENKAATPRQIKTITIEQQSRSEHSDEYAIQTCKSFTLRASQVAQFLEQATEIDSRFHTHDRYSPCHVTGAVEFADGSKGQWQIHSGRTGILKKENGQAVVLYCKKCRWKDPFSGGYDEGKS